MLKVTFCAMLKKAHIPIITQTPYQKFLAYMFPSTWNVVSSRTCPRNVEASVLLEKSTPEAFNGESDEAPPIIIVLPISILGELRKFPPTRP